ncbi:hypothetical protein B0H13DRAFT_2659884 [Mycena leptocephala]|nr:hypothetical protein B0H13DRAFT_2659884 [Mycena leptocephala]
MHAYLPSFTRPPLYPHYLLASRATRCFTGVLRRQLALCVLPRRLLLRPLALLAVHATHAAGFDARGAGHTALAHARARYADSLLAASAAAALLFVRAPFTHFPSLALLYVSHPYLSHPRNMICTFLAHRDVSFFSSQSEPCVASGPFVIVLAHLLRSFSVLVDLSYLSRPYPLTTSKVGSGRRLPFPPRSCPATSRFVEVVPLVHLRDRLRTPSPFSSEVAPRATSRFIEVLPIVSEAVPRTQRRLSFPFPWDRTHWSPRSATVPSSFFRLPPFGVLAYACEAAPVCQRSRALDFCCNGTFAFIPRSTCIVHIFRGRSLRVLPLHRLGSVCDHFWSCRLVVLVEGTPVDPSEVGSESEGLPFPPRSCHLAAPRSAQNAPSLSFEVVPSAASLSLSLSLGIAFGVLTYACEAAPVYQRSRAPDFYCNGTCAFPPRSSLPPATASLAPTAYHDDTHLSWVPVPTPRLPFEVVSHNVEVVLMGAPVPSLFEVLPTAWCGASHIHILRPRHSKPMLCFLTRALGGRVQGPGPIEIGLVCPHLEVVPASLDFVEDVLLSSVSEVVLLPLPLRLRLLSFEVGLCAASRIPSDGQGCACTPPSTR